MGSSLASTNNGTVLTSSGFSGHGAFVRQIIPGSWTPSLNQTTQNNSTIIACTWG
jgi:hypothetical protein